ncbi:TPR-like protein [Leucogyrophana mollusca]|uniref:TPR-like protein n=1 Tax=Leucogyrophana mollusca TaxID=85980 RepID=A0ACB8BGC9_9AGAM|nr:TPR-like protein [Leucogyrophana mollusca]
MSLSGLISGSECAVPFNPLSQVLKHTEGDRSLQQDRIAGPSSSRLQHLPGTAPTQASERDVAMARQFFEGQQGSAGPSTAFAPHMHPAELARLQEMNARTDLSEAWSREQPHQAAFYDNSRQVNWAAEFGGPQQQPGAATSAQPNVQGISGAQRPSYMGSGGLYNSSMSMGMYGAGMGPSFYQSYNGVPQTLSDQGKGKGREADFEAAFAQVAASMHPVQAESSSRIVEIDDSVTSVDEALKSVHLNDDAAAPQTNSEFSTVWNHLQESDTPPPKEDLAKWESEFNQLMTSQRDDLENDYSDAMQDAWGNSIVGESAESTKFDDNGMPILSEYVFEPSNKYLDPSTSTRSPLAEAKALLERNGSLSEAALLLEAAIQKGELGEGGYEAWILLGETRNMDEREDLGMRALVEGVRRAEAAGADGAGMLSLAISYTNESYDRASYNMLLRWLQAHFPTYPVPEETQQAVLSNSTWDSHTRITDAYLGLARQQYSQGIVDADVQIALGILFYNSGEYDRAKDCFESALSQRPQDYLLWNRLGSSLSNGSKPEEALGAYREALHLRPTYTRAIYNVGVACLNIGAHKEAAEHFLSALGMQEATGNGQTSDQLWFTLRRAFISMDRNDLAEMAKPENNTKLDLFRQNGFDF